MRYKYYEIICEETVIGVCSTDGEDDTLLHAFREDNVTAFGRISKKDFDRYGDDDWSSPISKIRYTPHVRTTLKLERLP